MRLTYVKYWWKGRPLSRANAQTKRDTEATTLKLETMQIAAIIITMIVEVVLDPVLTSNKLQTFNIQGTGLRRVEDFCNWQHRIANSLNVSNAKHQANTECNHHNSVRRCGKEHGSRNLLSGLLSLINYSPVNGCISFSKSYR
jgi:hypothetical protein